MKTNPETEKDEYSEFIEKKNGGGTGDSFVDLAGYAACGGEIHEHTT